MKRLIILALLTFTILVSGCSTKTNINANHIPKIVIYSPEPGVLISDSKVSINGTIMDANRDQEKVTAWIDNNEQVNGITTKFDDNKWSVVIDCSKLQNGSYTVCAHAVDKAGNLSEIKKLDIKINRDLNVVEGPIKINGDIKNLTGIKDGNYSLMIRLKSIASNENQAGTGIKVADGKANFEIISGMEMRAGDSYNYLVWVDENKNYEIDRGEYYSELTKVKFYGMNPIKIDFVNWIKYE